MLQVRKGGTGAARIRKLNLPWLRGGTQTIDTSGAFAFSAYYKLPDATTTTIEYGNVPLPEDSISSGTYKLKILYSNELANDEFDILFVKLAGFIEGDTNSTVLYFDVGISKTVSSVADTLTTLSYDLITLPKSGSVIQASFSRLGSADSNNGFMAIWSVWLEYLAFI